MNDTTVIVPDNPPAEQKEACFQFLEQAVEVNPTLRRDILEKAFHYSWFAHRNQYRKSGEPFRAHPVAVALILAEQKLDSATIAAGLLHDVLEDTECSLVTLRREFGEEIATLVDGVTKIKTFHFKSLEERQAETFRKMLLSMARDIRVIIIKFADRLHNLRTLKYLPPNKVRQIAKETQDVYAPLAHRLGMAKIKWELEDLAFKHLHPHEYKELVSKIVANRYERESLIESFSGPLRHELDRENIQATVIGRPKHFYSIYRKMMLQHRPFGEIFDLLAIRVITATVRDCYHILGIVHRLWQPLQDRFKDYISTPKSNGYQSLHTTVFGKNGTIVEIQIRTWEMHQIAEDGIAAHWLYKDGEHTTPSRDDRALTWLKNTIEWQKDFTDSAEFFEFFKVDLYHSEIFVFTPKGDLITLPKGATIRDFAFAVHTDLGLHCIGAKVDGTIHQPDMVLKSGSTVTVLQSASKKPSIDWLREVITPKARSSIRRALKNAGRNESIELGKKIVEAQYKKLHLSTDFNSHAPGLLKFLGINTMDRFYELIGKGEVGMGRFMQFFHINNIQESMPSRMVSRFFNSFTPKQDAVLVSGGDNSMVRLAKCCTPIPGDAIVGFVTTGRGIAVHRFSCSHTALFLDDPERRIEVNWDTRENRRYDIFLEITGEDRPGLLHEMTSILMQHEAHITEGSLKTMNNRIRNVFKLEIHNRNQLKQILRKISKIKGVETASRTKDYFYPLENNA